MYTHQQTYYWSIICAHAHIDRVTVDGHAIVEDEGDKLISSQDALKLPAFRFFLGSREFHVSMLSSEDAF
jgi:hypothetical protein